MTVAELCAWRGEGVTVGGVLDALDRLRRAQRGTATRTSVVTLVALATDADEAERACEATRGLRPRHPGRTITLRCEAGGASRIDAEVVLEAADDDDRSWWEEVRLRVAGPVAGHLDTVVEPLLLPEVPVALWCVGRLPSPADPLLDPCDAVLVDTRDATEFAGVEALLRRRPTVDLSWMRLRPWRHLLAGLFDGAEYRPFVDGVEWAEVAGKDGPRRLLAAWLSARLRLAPGSIRLTPARHVSMRLTAAAGGRRGVFEVTRREGERLVRAGARVADGPSHDDLWPLPDDSLPWSLAEALTHLERDRIYEQTVHALLGFPT